MSLIRLEMNRSSNRTCTKWIQWSGVLLPLIAELFLLLHVRYYTTMLQTLQACDKDTVAVVRDGLVARLGPDMETFLQLVQNQPCAVDSDAAAYNNPSSWRNMPVLNIQPGFRGRDPTHLFARKRSLDDSDLNTDK